MKRILFLAVALVVCLGAWSAKFSGTIGSYPIVVFTDDYGNPQYYSYSSNSGSYLDLSYNEIQDSYYDYGHEHFRMYEYSSHGHQSGSFYGTHTYYESNGYVYHKFSGTFTRSKDGRQFKFSFSGRVHGSLD